MSCDCNNRTGGVIGTLGGQLVRGFSAYEIAVLNGFEGTEVEWLESLKGGAVRRIESLTDTKLAMSNIVEAVEPAEYYGDDLTALAAYGITEPGWYVLARITAPGQTKVTAQTTVEGAAGYIATVGENHVDVAVKFEVAAMTQLVTVTWSSEMTETLAFKNTDLAVRNLDYRTTFYVYDIAPFATWTFGPTEDAAVAAGKTYYMKESTAYTEAELTAEETLLHYYKDKYDLTGDETFQAGKTYYTKEGDVYTAATVTEGEAVTDDTYYEHSYVIMEEEEAVQHYTKSGTTYTEAEAPEEFPPVYYEHKCLTFEGMTRNVTYRFNELVDAPIRIVLPAIADNGYGAWFEIQMHYNGQYSCELVMPSDDVKAGTAQTQKQSAGINVMDLHYTNVDGRKTWTLINTHSNLPVEGGQ